MIKSGGTFARKGALLGVRLWALAGLFGVTTLGCPCTDSVLNESPWLRWQLFARFGADKVCDEMTRRGALVHADLPVPGFARASGRFFPQTCQSSLNNDARTLTIWMSGNGYAWTPATQKMSFDCTVSVEYKPDFHKKGSTLYVWFDVAAPPASPQIKITHVEQRVTNAALRLYPVEWFVNKFASSFVQEQLARGFTVIRDSEGEDYALGKLPVGQRPVHSLKARGKDRFTLANESVELRGQQQDFLGPFLVDDDDRALFVKMQVSGPPVDLFVVSREVGHMWRMKYQSTSPAPPPPPGAPIVQQASTPPSGVFEGWVPLRKGLYQIVLDNSASAGLARPPLKLPTPFDPSLSQSSSISYVVQVGDRP